MRFINKTLDAMNDGIEFDEDAAFADAGDDDGGSDTESDDYIEADMDLENNLRLNPL